MNDGLRMTGRLVKAARALVGISREDFAASADLPVQTLEEIERSGSAWIRSEHVQRLKQGFDHFGLVLVEESDGMGAGVRLKFTRQDVGQIARLEGEGGLIGSDDAP